MALNLIIILGLSFFPLGLLKAEKTKPQLGPAKNTVKDDLRGKINKIQKQLVNLKNLSVEFKQKTTSTLIEREPYTVKGTGFFKLDKSGKKFALVYTSPKEEWRFDGNQLRHLPFTDEEFTKDAQPVWNQYPDSSKLSKQVAEMVDIILEPGQVFKSYNVRSLDIKGQATEIALVPIKDSGIDELRIFYVAKKNYFETIKIKYKTGNSTEFTFENPQTKVIEDSQFLLPKGAKEREFK